MPSQYPIKPTAAQQPHLQNPAWESELGPFKIEFRTKVLHEAKGNETLTHFV